MPAVLGLFPVQHQYTCFSLHVRVKCSPSQKTEAGEQAAGGGGARMCSASRGCPTGAIRRGRNKDSVTRQCPSLALLLLCHLSLPAPSPLPLLVTRLCKRMRCQGLGKPPAGRAAGLRDGRGGCTHGKAWAQPPQARLCGRAQVRNKSLQGLRSAQLCFPSHLQVWTRSLPLPPSTS